ncbi:MAG: hypothetical protein OXB96_02015 [Candidatus Kaiserbacteria bacterium]|nr:hypothetical protein [Candidatus Kaiserbacteria bacterium]
MNDRQDPLYSIIGDAVRAKLLRVFALNKDSLYVAKDFTKALRKREQSINDVLRWLEADGIITKKKLSASERKSKGVTALKGYGFNKRYPHQVFLDMLIRESLPTEKDVLAQKITRVSGVRCVITTDMFIEKRGDRVDIVVASMADNEADLQDMVQEAERSIGRELRCAFLTVNDLLHRIRTNDRFIRNILEGKHSIHLDKVGLPEK